ncbi:NAD(P)H-dependent FMN reductase [Algoriphagus sp. 4150]|uniref:NADPH-dependent FMN reductase n=1 Tax=Algoriphagus sp. 4150 TaxID=2817756 RepID=UPI002861492E|nr:NAD(P)H-dependent oxidoreductase [Algoriphagus sp. 4150]MDR7131754.1 NAD(P)H-dependent FMN reductase [Algoriphagus sp. 4150]
MRIVILAGSIRKNRKSIQVCRYLEKQLSGRGVEIDLVDPLDDPLPIFDDFADENPVVHKAVQKMENRLGIADAMVFVTPEYNGSFSGVLKNTLDYFWNEFSGKPIGVAAVSAGKMGGINASVQLQHVVLSLGAYPLPVKLLVRRVDHVFDDNLNPVDEEFVRNADKFIDQFLWFANAVSTAKKPKKYENVS